MSLAQAASLLDCSPEHLERWVDSGDVQTRGSGPGTQICLQIDGAPSIQQLASAALDDPQKPQAIALALAALAQQQLRQTRRYLQLALLTLALGTVAGFGAARQYGKLESALVATSEHDLETNRHLQTALADRDRLTQSLQQTKIESAELRARVWTLTAREQTASAGVLEHFAMLLDLP